MSARVRLLASAVLTLPLIACTADYEGESAGAGEPVGESSDAVTKVCGADRYKGVQGADVSKYQGDFNWKAAGVEFGLARISDGTTYVDSWFDANWQKMKDGGIVRGAYQYFRPGQSATAQADMVVKKVGKLGAGDLPCVIDVEATDGQSPATIASKVQTWLDVVEQGTGKRPIIYTGPYFWQDKVGSTAFGKYPLWIAHYGTTCPLVPPGWTKWTFWQYCDGQTQYCSNGKGWDRDVFNGTSAELQAFAGGTAASFFGATFVEQSFPLAVSALEMKAGETLPAFITLKNTGTAPWDSNTRLGTTEPRDRSSPFADSSWLGPNRPAAVTGTVAPGQTYKFAFNLHAPSEPGTYHEHFGVVQEGTTWFSDSGQGGPPDNQLEAQIDVVASTGSGGTAGAAGSGGGLSETGGTGGAAGSAGQGGDSGSGGSKATGGTKHTSVDDAEGCACRAAGSSRDRAPLLLLLALAWPLRRRRSARVADAKTEPRLGC
ncbi:MAG: GH25 family lysozyme [Polyangiaceae bacterium]